MTQLTTPEPVQAHYARTASRRDVAWRSGPLTAHGWAHHLRTRVIDSLLQHVPSGGEGLDVGTGTGVWAEHIARRCRRVTGIDFVEENLRIARRNAGVRRLLERVDYVLDDAQRLEQVADSSVDLAIEVSVLQHMPQQAQALQRLGQVIRPGGSLVLLVHNRRCLYNRNLRSAGGSIAVNDYSDTRQLCDQLREAGFDIEEVRYNWLCLNDLLLRGASRRLLAPLLPVRLGLLATAAGLQRLLGRWRWANRLFREIVVLARRKEAVA